MTQLTQSQQDAIDQQQAGGAYSSNVSQVTRETAIDSSDPADLETNIAPSVDNSGQDSDQNQDNVGDSQPVPEDQTIDNSEAANDGTSPTD